MNRTIQPELTPLKKIAIPKITIQNCSNGIPLHILDMGEEEVIRVDIVFSVGSWEQQKKMESLTTASMLKEGTTYHTSAEIAKKIDYYGAIIQAYASYHYTIVTLCVLTKHLESTLKLLEEIVKAPIFPENELKIIMNQKKQSFLVDRSKVQYMAAKEFSSLLYGEKHPYGRKAEEQDFDNITSEDLRRYHYSFYHSKNCFILLSGKIKTQELNLIEQYFGKTPWGSLAHKPEVNHAICLSPKKDVFLLKEDAIQSAIKIGLPTILLNHPDFPKIKILNTILGGYFGSRLMSNIREDKGYTYGIGSSLCTFLTAAYWSISTQAACAFTQPLITEIIHEIERLQNEPIPAEELTMVKNYMTGKICRSLESPFTIAETYLSLVMEGADLSAISQQVKAIDQITTSELKELANHYLPTANLYKVIAGKIN